MPTFTSLTRDESLAMLAEHHVARLAYSFHDRVDVEPIGYVFADNGLVFRTAPGSKLATLAHHPWVALEIDEVKGMFNWQSVVVKGTMYMLQDIGTPAEIKLYESAIHALQHAEPKTFHAHDPAPFRTVVMRLELDDVSGRRCR